MTGRDALTGQEAPPPSMLSELEALRVALPGYNVVITSHGLRYRYEALAPDRGGLPGRAGLVAQRAPHPRRLGGHVGTAHVPDADVHWPSLDTSPYPGQVWAIEAELTPKPVARTTAIMRGLLARNSDYGPEAANAHGPRYVQVVYLAAPAARPVVTRAIGALPAPLQARIVVRDLPEEAAPTTTPRYHHNPGQPTKITLAIWPGTLGVPPG